MQTNYGRPVFLKEFQAAINFLKVSPLISKIPNSLKQVLQIYSEIYIFCVPQKKILQNQSAKVSVKVPGESYGNIDDDVMKFICSKFGSEMRR